MYAKHYENDVMMYVYEKFNNIMLYMYEKFNWFNISDKVYTYIIIV